MADVKIGTPYRYYFNVLDGADAPVLALVNGDFDKFTVDPDGARPALPFVVSEVDDTDAQGLYVAEVTPDKLGTWTGRVSETTNLPRGREFSFEVGAFHPDGSIERGTAAAGASNTLTLAATASADDDTYNGATLTILEGLGVGQSRTITDYVGSTQVATVVPPWATTPDNTSVYAILPGPTTLTGNVAGDVLGNLAGGVLQNISGDIIGNVNGRVLGANGASDKAITNSPSPPTTTVFGTDLAETDDGFWTGQVVRFTSGANLGLARKITGYDGTTFELTVYPALPTAPSPADTFDVIPGDTHLDEPVSTRAKARDRESAVNDAGATTTVFVTDLAEAVNDFWAGQVLTFTSGALAGQSTVVRAYDGTSKAVTVDALTSAPADDVTFVLTPNGLANLDAAVSSRAPEGQGLVASATVDGAGTLDAWYFSTTLPNANVGAYVNCVLVFRSTAGDLAGCSRKIVHYNEVDKRVTVDPGLPVDPIGGEEFDVFPGDSMVGYPYPVVGYDNGGSTSSVLQVFITDPRGDGGQGSNVAGDSGVLDALKGAYISFTSGHLKAQTRKIISSTGFGPQLTVDPPFTSAPTAGEPFVIIPGEPLIDVAISTRAKERATTGAVMDAGATTTGFITTLIDVANDHWNGSVLLFVDGALAGEARRIRDYVGSTKAVVTEAFSSAPANAEAFVILPAGLINLDNADATVSSRLPTASYTAPPTTSDIATALLVTPANKLTTDVGGKVSLADDAVSAAALATAAINKLTDVLFKRTATSVRASSDGAGGTSPDFNTLLGAIAKLTGKIQQVSTDLITYKEDGTTVWGTQPLTTVTGADPITGAGRSTT